MGLGDERPLIELGKQEAARRGTFEPRKAPWDLLCQLFQGHWHDNFVTLQPGQTLIACNDDRVLDVK